MRSGQQNKRGRGRSSSGGRKNGNPLSRSYDSSGPDVKIRGTAQHIADKYSTMARDALGSGDTVMAENYLQHAEHYNRIILTAQAQLQERYQRDDREASDRDQPAADRDQPAADRNQQSANRGETSDEAEVRNGTAVPVIGSGPQPVIEGTPMEMAIDEENSRQQLRRNPLRRRGPARPKRTRNGNGSADDAAPEQQTAQADADAGSTESEKAPVPAEASEQTLKADAASEA